LVFLRGEKREGSNVIDLKRYFKTDVRVLMNDGPIDLSLKGNERILESKRSKFMKRSIDNKKITLTLLIEMTARGR